MSADPVLAAIASLGVEVSSLRGEVSSLRGEVSSLRAEVSAEVSSLGGQVSSLRAEVSSLRADFLSELGRTRADIMGKVVDLQDATTRLRDDVAVNMGGIDAVRQANDNTRADVSQLREQVSVMWKQLKRAEADIRELKGSA